MPRAAAAAVIIAALVGATLAGAQPAAEIDRAKDLYTSARKALDEGRTDDAIRDFGAAYDITKDPVMFYWIGSANEKSGKCELAVVYYGRYLHEAQPTDEFRRLVESRLTGCGGTPDAGSATPAAPEPSPSPTPSPSPIAAGSGSGSALPPPPPPLKGRNQGPWLMVGGAVALVTIGAVLAYSANASENDISDLYVGLQGTPPVFDSRTKKRYDDLIAEGERYQNLSRLSFALAAGLGIGAGVWFYLRRDPTEHKAMIVPTATDRGAGVSAIVRW